MPAQQPIANMRRIQFITTESSPHYASKAELCTYCGALPKCVIKGSKRRGWASQTLKRCDQFQPVLAFTQPKGIDDEFNTFRMGTTWVRRVAPGSVVGLLDGKTKSIIGQARVTAVYCGDKATMAKAYGEDNHLLIARGIKGEAVQAFMLKVLRNTFGKLIYQSQEKATVIYLERIKDGEESQRPNRASA